jgi:hypothetical protein
MTPVLRRVASREQVKGTIFLPDPLDEWVGTLPLNNKKDMLRLDDTIIHMCLKSLGNRFNEDWMSDLRSGQSPEKGRMKQKLLLLPLLVLVLALLPLILSRSLWDHAN